MNGSKIGKSSLDFLQLAALLADRAANSESPKQNAQSSAAEEVKSKAMASVGIVKDATKYLATQQAESPPELAAEWANLEELYNKK